jgi:D-alanyl-D-alanine carboxypeptidase (penicillin-binding protein 5/6)
MAATGSAMVAAPSAKAESLRENGRYAGIVVDAVSGEVMYSERADSARYPASLTKIMTLYMVFDALERGDIKPTDMITISSHAASQAPVKVYLRPGDRIDVDTAMRLAAMYSANDMAVALAEKVAGNEQRFAAMMTVKAQELGMTHTHFVNANGLPDPRQISSARDLAILARAVMRDFPQYYSYFDLNSVTYRGRTYYNHNPLHGMPGVDGMKTGYTNAAGENLVASQVKGGHRLIAVMLGADSKAQRRDTVSELLEVGFNVEARRDRGEVITVAQGEFDRALAMGSHAYNYTLLASNSQPAAAPAPLTDAQLRDALQGSEQANATDSNVVQAKATVEAPALAQALTAQAAAQDGATQKVDAAGTPAAPVPYTQLAATDQATIDAAIARQGPTGYAAKPDVMKVAMTETAAPKPEARAQERADARAARAASDDRNDEPAPERGRKGKRHRNPEAVWSIQVGAFKERSLANNWVRNIQHRFDDALADASSQVSKTGQGWYRTRFASLTKAQAHEACRAMAARRLECMVVRPDEG